MNKTKCTQFSKKMVAAVVISEIALCIGTVALSCYGFDMTIGVDIIKANIPFTVVVFAAYSGNSAVEKWLVHTKSGSAAAEAVEEILSNG